MAVDSGRVAIVANSSPVAIVLDRIRGTLGTVDLGEWDCWASAAEILCPLRAYSLDYLAQQATAISPDPTPAAAQTVATPEPLVTRWRAWLAARPGHQASVR